MILSSTARQGAASPANYLKNVRTYTGVGVEQGVVRLQETLLVLPPPGTVAGQEAHLNINVATQFQLANK